MNTSNLISGLINRGLIDDVIIPQYSDSEFIDQIILIADWNDNKLSDILDHSVYTEAGLTLGFSDEWYTCSACGAGISIHNDNAIMLEHDILCKECCLNAPDDVLEYHVDNDLKALPAWFVVYALENNLIELLDNGYETGLYSGMNDDPAKIMKSWHYQNKYNLVFGIRSSNPFMTGYNIYQIKEASC